MRPIPQVALREAIPISPLSSQYCINTMAPTTARLQRRVELTDPILYLIISLATLAACGAFCSVIFCLVCRKQRRTEKAHRRMQDERQPFVAPLYPPQATTPYHYYGPLELQDNRETVDIGPVPAQQIDGYPAAVCPPSDVRGPG